MPASNFTRSNAGALLVGGALVLCAGCRRDEAPQPVPLGESDLPSQSGARPAAGSATAVKAPPPRPLIAKACCDALARDAKAAPEPTTAYMKQAATACYAGIEQRKDKHSMLKILRGSLGGGSLPAACK